MPEETAPVVEAPAVETAPVTEPVTAPEGTETPPASTEPTFGEHQAYVEQLRRENAAARTRAKEYEEVFQSYTPEQQQVLFRMVRGLADPTAQKATAAEWKEIAERILASDEPTLADGSPDPANRPLTRREFDELQRQQDTQRSQADAIRQIEREATDLGFSPLDAQGNPNMRYSMLLHEAQKPDIAGDLNKAAEAVKKYETGIIDAHAKELASTGEKFPPAAGTAGNVGAGDTTPIVHDWKWASKAAMEMVKAKAGET